MSEYSLNPFFKLRQDNELETGFQAYIHASAHSFVKRRYAEVFHYRVPETPEQEKNGAYYLEYRQVNEVKRSLWLRAGGEFRRCLHSIRSLIPVDMTGML